MDMRNELTIWDLATCERLVEREIRRHLDSWPSDGATGANLYTDSLIALHGKLQLALIEGGERR